MKKIILSIAVVFSITIGTNAQTVYTEQYQTGSPQLAVDIGGVLDGEIAFGDIDGDGDIDLFKTGYGPIINYHNYTAQIHVNDGNGNFTLKNMFIDGGYKGYRYSACEMLDVDGDSDLDIIVSGANGWSFDDVSTDLYLNDGSGNFTESTQIFMGFKNGDIQSIDIEKDGDLDLIITGRNEENKDSTVLYKNDGSGVFTLDSTAEFSPMSNSTIVKGDLNGDGEEDIILAHGQTIEVYQNANGVFTLLSANTLPGSPAHFPTIKLIDVDNDKDEDILVLGSYWSNGRSYMYINNGNFSFSEYQPGPFPTRSFSSTGMDVADVDQDGNMDVIYTAYENNGPHMELLMGNSDSIFTPNSTFDNSIKLSGPRNICKFVDLDGDGLKDILVTGRDDYSYGNKTFVFKNQGTGSFTKVKKAIEIGYRSGASTITDIDGDGDNDLLIAGQLSSYQAEYKSHLYLNDGSGQLTQDSSPFGNISGGVLLHADIDGDNDMDVILSGRDSANSNMQTTKVYKNNGSGNYTEIVNSEIDTLLFYKGEAFDYDNDGDVDIVCSYLQFAADEDVGFFKNNGSGVFTRDYTNTINGRAAMAHSDYDNDGDLDICIASTSRNGICGIYTNNGSGTFTITTDSFHKYEKYTDVANIDVDNDGDMDLVTQGYLWGNFNHLYINNGGVFTELDSAIKVDIVGEGSIYGDIIIADYNNDGYDDILYSNVTFKNNGGNSFSVSNDLNFTRYTNAWHLAMGDLNGDGLDDYFFSGQTQVGEVSSSLYYTSTCPISNYTDILTACDSAVWIDGNTYYASNTAAQYTISKGASSGCDSVVSLNLTINSSPSLTIIKNGNTLEVATGYSDYKWYINNSVIAGASTNTHTPTANGDYLCEATGNSCQGSSSSFSFTTLSVREPSSNISIYPNPASSSITIQTNEQTESISVYSADGRLVLNQDGSSKQIDISTLPSGLYTIQVRQQQGTGYAKFIKN